MTTPEYDSSNRARWHRCDIPCTTRVSTFGFELELFWWLRKIDRKTYFWNNGYDYILFADSADLLAFKLRFLI
jgi:hypothetical protein